jgi:hypothetical protein
MASPGKKSFLLRIDPKLWSDLNTWSQQEMRSLNGQLEYLLREAVRKRNGGKSKSSRSSSASDGPNP